MSDQDRSAPEFRLRVGGRDLPSETLTDIKKVAVHQDVDVPAMFTFELINWDMHKLEMKWSENQDFDPGKSVEILLGYRDHLEKIFSGEITGLELKINGKETPALEVRGYDRRHRLMRGRNTRSFQHLSDSSIARQVATEASLSADVEDSGPELDYILQHNQTDLEFLLERAARIGYEVTIDDRNLQFRSRRNNEGDTLTLDREADLIEFYPRLTTMNQSPEIRLRGWDPSNKATLTATAAAGSENGRMGGTTSGPAATKQAFGSSAVTIVDRPVTTQTEADKGAKSRFNEMALWFISGDGLAIGRTDITAGKVIKMSGLGKRFSGAYYVTAAVHTYSPSRGYRTAFSTRRNAE